MAALAHLRLNWGHGNISSWHTYCIFNTSALGVKHKILQKTFDKRSIFPHLGHDLENGNFLVRRCRDNKGICISRSYPLFISIPPQVTVSRFVQRVKVKTSHKLLSKYPYLRMTCWGSGNLTDEVIKQYILKDKTALLTTILKLTVSSERVGEADHTSFSCQSKLPTESRLSIHFASFFLR